VWANVPVCSAVAAPLAEAVAAIRQITEKICQMVIIGIVLTLERRLRERY
jgi:hypothetical protein